MSIAYTAMIIAREAHKNQARKYTGAPYTDHLAEVAGMVATVTNWNALNAECLIATAWLHDVIEDCGISPADLTKALYDKHNHGVSETEQVVRGVMLLSDLESGNRATRKRLSCERLAKAPRWVQTIKYADLISNTSSIVEHDPAFAKVYLREKRELLEAMTKGDGRLRAIAWDLCEQETRGGVMGTKKDRELIELAAKATGVYMQAERALGERK